MAARGWSAPPTAASSRTWRRCTGRRTCLRCGWTSRPRTPSSGRPGREAPWAFTCTEPCTSTVTTRRRYSTTRTLYGGSKRGPRTCARSSGTCPCDRAKHPSRPSPTWKRCSSTTTTTARTTTGGGTSAWTRRRTSRAWRTYRPYTAPDGTTRSPPTRRSSSCRWRSRIPRRSGYCLVRGTTCACEDAARLPSATWTSAAPSSGATGSTTSCGCGGSTAGSRTWTTGSTTTRPCGCS